MKFEISDKSLPTVIMILSAHSIKYSKSPQNEMLKSVFHQFFSNFQYLELSKNKNFGNEFSKYFLFYVYYTGKYVIKTMLKF